jgi:hypothetical protein
MPVQFLTAQQRADYGRYVQEPTALDLARYFHLDDADHQRIASKRGSHNRLGFALQLTTVRYLGRFLDEGIQAPSSVLNTLVKQLGLSDETCLVDYHDERQRFRYMEEICHEYGYQEIAAPQIAFRLARWLYVQCWTGTDRPTVLFERATTWLLAHKILLPGASTLERFIAKLRGHVEQRLWESLTQSLTVEQQQGLDTLLLVPEGERRSSFEQMRSGPTHISGPSLVRAVERLLLIRSQGISLPLSGSIPSSRIAGLAQFAARAKVTALQRLPTLRRMATLTAFLQTLEAAAHDDALAILEGLLQEIFGEAAKANQKVRLRSLRDLDAAQGKRMRNKAGNENLGNWVHVNFRDIRVCSRPTPRQSCL